MTFMNAAMNMTETKNGMMAFKSTQNACLDLFSKIGASRGKDLWVDFQNAYMENPDVAVRILLWARDVREGAGEREVFRKIFNHLSKKDNLVAIQVANKVSELGRWDDLLSAEFGTKTWNYVVEMIRKDLIYRKILKEIDHLCEQQCKEIFDSL